LAKITGMASSSKQRRGSSSKQSSAKAHVISVRRKSALPRKANVSTGLRKPVVQPLIGAPMEPLTTALAASNNKAHNLQPTTADDVSAMAPLQAPEVEALDTVETEVEASAILEETTIVEAPFALPVEAVTFPSTEIAQLPVSEEMREAPLARTAAASPAPAAPAPHHGKRALVTIVSQLLSALRRWTGIR